MVSREWIRTFRMTLALRPRPVFIAAFPREIAAVVAHRGWRADRSLSGRNIHLFEHEDAILACAGMGAHRATLALEAALALGPASELISVGWAGACTGRLAVGEVVRADVVIDTRTGERFSTAGENQGRQIVVTVAAPASLKEKQRLEMSYHASAVDMEAAAVARIARARELPFYAIKAISDAYDFELPGMEKFTTPEGQIREAAFALRLAFHPSLWKPVATLAKGSKLAAGNLQAAIGEHISHTRERKS
jgi:adenosylhomocysteine nucleosidase